MVRGEINNDFHHYDHRKFEAGNELEDDTEVDDRKRGKTRW